MIWLQLFGNTAYGSGEATNAFKKVRHGHALVRVRAGAVSHHHDRLHECLHDLFLTQARFDSPSVILARSRICRLLRLLVLSACEC